MGNTIGKLFVVFLAVVMLFIYPLIHMFEQQDKTSRLFVFNETTQFVDAIRNVGHLTPEIYETFTQKLAATDNTYTIAIEHRHQRYDPIYGDPMDPATFEDDYATNYEALYTKEVMAVLFPTVGNGATYEFSSGDYLRLSITNNNKTLGTRVKQLVLGGAIPAEVIFVQYGGMIK